MDELQRILTKIDAIEENIKLMQVDLAAKSQQEKNHQQNIERFWQTSWPETLAKLDSNSQRIAALEMDMTRLQTKILVYGSIFFVGAPIASMFLIEFLKKALSKGL